MSNPTHVWFYIRDAGHNGGQRLRLIRKGFDVGEPVDFPTASYRWLRPCSKAFPPETSTP